VSTANAATTTATNANSKADQAIAAVASSINYTLVANVAAIPASPANNTYIEISNSTGLQSFTPLVGLPAGFVGDAGLTVRLVYQTSNTSWNWLTYFANNSETRYLKLAGGTLTGALTLSGAPASGLQATTKTYVDTADATLTTAAAAAQTTANAAVVRAGDTMTGALAHPLGAAATPSITFTGDTNTGIYSPGADQVAISTNGTGRLFVDSSGNVGIGAASTNSSVILEASKNLSATYATQNLANTNAGGYVQQLFSVGGVNGPNGQAQIGYAPGMFFAIGPTSSDTTTPIVFRTNNATEYMRLTASGRLGLGVSAPSTSLQIGGGSGLQQTYISGGGYDLYLGASGGTMFGFASQAASLIFNNTNVPLGIGTNQSQPLVLGTGGAERVRVTAGGLVGIGTTAPSAQLHVQSASGSGVLKVGDSTNTFIARLQANAGDGSVNLFNESNYALTFGTNNAERARIDSSGRVGIGTTAPNSKLAVSNGGAESFEFYPADASNVNKINYYNRSGAVYCDAVQNAASHQFAISGTEKARLDSSGRLLVGTSSGSAKFEVLSNSTDTSFSTPYINYAAVLRNDDQTNNNYSGLSFNTKSSLNNDTTVACIAAQCSNHTSGSVAGTLGFFTTGSSLAERFRISSDGSISSVIPGGSTLYPSFGCRAWVNFNGTTATPSTIRGSGNVSSVTKNGTGNYTVNFTTAMPDANYSAIASDDYQTIIPAFAGSSTTGVSIRYTGSGSTLYDITTACVAIFR
jgi:hypothetical protein